MRKMIFVGLIAAAAFTVLVLADHGISRAEMEVAIDQATRTEQPDLALQSAAWVTCGWTSGVYAPVRLCD